MGLDITAYSGLVAANGNEAFDDEGDLKYDEEWVQIYKNPDFPGSADELKDRIAYKPSDSIRFRAGSYRGYNYWRDGLAELAGYPLTKYIGMYDQEKESHEAGAWASDSGPFYEMINFSDCEGVIGGDISKKLAADFAKYEEEAKAFRDERFRDLYFEWKKAFEMASDSGAVEFH